MSNSEYFYVAIDPVAFSIGPLSVHWYGIMYLLAFLFFWMGGKYLAEKRPWMGWQPKEVGDFLFYGMLGVIIGGRLGYVFFYSFDALIENPLYLFRINEGGMSFHGGLLGVIVAIWLYARKTGRTFWGVADFITPLGPIGLGLGRLGNFIGGELWGRITDVPWAMVFANAIQSGGWQSEALRQSWAAGELDHLARHPSQLYQAGMEGFLLGLFLLWYSAKERKPAAISGLFLVGYGVFRLVAEYFREPDAHIGYLAGEWLTMGMLLSLPMILAGVLMMTLPIGGKNKVADRG
ncbi:MAG TPA: prolipoprotein diacylglyceryl transferase [Xanthomonadales bacterium]|nr:prolipoprotein diacylglyceryl transferase [Xanthomonadales bacterium]